jgi:hypothetical protein
MKNFAIASAYFAAFFGSLGCAALCLWLTVAAEFGALEIAEFEPALGIDSRLFITIMFATLSISFVALAGGVIAMLGRR